MTSTHTVVGRLTLALVALLAVLAALLAVPESSSAGIRHPRVVSANPSDRTPHVVDGGGVTKTSVHAFAQKDDRTYVGGNFQRVANVARTRTFARSNLMAFNARTGAVAAFRPVVDGPVWALEARAGWLFVAGSFRNVNGVPRRGVVKLNAATGAVDPQFNAQLPTGRVQDMHMVNGRVYIGGTFPEKLLALDPVTGADTAYINLPITGTTADNAGPTDVLRFAIDQAGTRLVAVGNFTTVGTAARARAFMLDLGPTAATLDPWYYEPLASMCRGVKFPAYLRGVDFAPNGNSFVLVSTGFVPQPGGVGRDICDAAARFETSESAPERPTWINYTGGDTLLSVVNTKAAVYVQGHQRWLDNPGGRDSAGPGAVSRPGIGAINPRTGLALPWNPGKTRAVGGKVLYATSSGLWVGSDGANFAGEYHDNVAFCPL